MNTSDKVKFITIFIVFLFICSCNSSDNKKDRVDILHFEKDINNYSSLNDNERNAFKNKYNDLIQLLYSGNNIDSTLSNLPSSRIYKTFKSDVDKRFALNDTLAFNLGQIRNSLQRVFPDQRFPKIITYITPYNQSIVTTDSTIMIGLNHYLGADHPMYNYFEDYRKKNKSPQYISIDVAEVISRKITSDSKDKDNLLGLMISGGVIIAITQQLLPDTPLYKILGYTEDELEWCEKNETATWKFIVSKDILYSNSPMIISNMINPAPFTTIISQEAPGRMGRWIGYKIVEAFLKHSSSQNIEDNYNDILNSKPQTILIKSCYDGR